MTSLRWRQLFSRSSLVTGLTFALAGGLFGGLVFGVTAGVAAGRTVGLVAAAGAGLADMLAAGLSQSSADDASPITPPASWQRAQAFGFIVGLVLGAGKTTTVECVEGLRAPDRGEISVLGLDPQRDRAELTE